VTDTASTTSSTDGAVVALMVDDSRTAELRAVPAPDPARSPRTVTLPSVSSAQLRGALRGGAIVFVALIAGFALFLFVLSGFEHNRTQVGLDRAFRSDLATLSTPIGGDIAEGTPIARLAIPDIGLHQVVVEGSKSGTTRAAPGHVRATPLPGQIGNSVIVLRRTTFGAPFRRVNALSPGDRITVVTGQGSAVYEVTGRRTVSTTRRAIENLYTSKGTAQLTLVTSDPPVLASRLVAVQARLVGKPKASTPHSGRLGSDELGFTGQYDNLLPLLLWLEALLVVCVGAAWVVRRWRFWSAYLVVVPVVAAVAWVVFDEVTRLLSATL
jgi:LPXTG-site transpeptidase (sortase) family protein